MKRPREPPKEERQKMTAQAMRTEDAYERGYADAIEDMRRMQKRKQRRKQAKKARRLYFLMQKAYGVAVLAFTVFAVWLLEGDATIALITVPLGLYLIFSKEMLIVNDYYWYTKERAGYGRQDHTAN